ncbi:MAG: AlbA family DNA-binding domain-containing protein [Gammaproteobacteria bacterium]
MDNNEPRIIDRLVDSLRETLQVECKPWLDLSGKPQQATFIKTCIALRNQNGGYLIVGVKNQPRELLTPTPDYIPEQYIEDNLHKILSGAVSEIFELQVHQKKINDNVYPVIQIPDGVQTPVCATKTISAEGVDGPQEASRGKVLLRDRSVYVRTLMAGGAVATSEAGSKDWPELIRRCVENRETHIALFLQRNFSPDALKQYGDAISTLLSQQPGSIQPQRVDTILDRGAEAFRRAADIGPGDDK